MNFQDKLIIAVDFDGTIVEDAYPKIGKPRLFAFETLKRFEKEGHRLILWTYRSGKKLKEAVAFCETNGIQFYAVNESYPNEEVDDSKSRKIFADLFIDDRNIGGVLGWGEIYQLILKENISIKEPKQKRGLISFFRKTK